MLELGATFFRFDLDQMLYDMSVGQLITMITVRTNRELKQQEEAERRAAERDGGRPPPPPKETETPSVSDITRVFGNFAT